MEELKMYDWVVNVPEIDNEEGYKLRVKPITTAKRLPEEQQIRDTFWTPNYAIDLLLPFIPKNISHIWECASGGRKISRKMLSAGYRVFESDIKPIDEVTYYNFISDPVRTDIDERYVIITNPPFSVKDLFVDRCFEYGRPFALLINADYSQQTINWIKRGCEKIIPTARISFITPNILRRIHEGEVWKLVKDNYPNLTFNEMKADEFDLWESILRMDEYKNISKYEHIDLVPSEILYKYSASQFHSMWLTYGFDLGRTETFVDLTVEQRKCNI